MKFKLSLEPIHLARIPASGEDAPSSQPSSSSLLLSSLEEKSLSAVSGKKKLNSLFAVSGAEAGGAVAVPFR